MNSLRRWFLTGLLVLVPLVITLLVLGWVIGILDQTLLLLPASWQPERLIGYKVPGFGVVLTLVVILLAGAIASNLLGRTLLRWGEVLLTHIPIVRSIYSSVKQVSDTIFSDKGNAFRQAVLVQWPREGVWTIGFVTGTSNGEVAARLGALDYVSVFVPTTPNPTSGYFMLFARHDCLELQMSVDAALKYVVSMGVVAPAGAAAPERPQSHC